LVGGTLLAALLAPSTVDSGGGPVNLVGIAFGGLSAVGFVLLIFRVSSWGPAGQSTVVAARIIAERSDRYSRAASPNRWRS
jgi:hypothetical protein